MELRHLRYFAAVADEENFGRAARRLNISQPPLWRQIRQLEEEIGVRLFNRAGRGVRLTAAGREFVRGAREVLEQAERAVRNAQRAARGEAGVLTVGFTESATYSGVLTRVFRLLRRRFPEISLDLAPKTTLEQWDALRHQRIQVGFVYHLPPDEPGFLHEPVWDDTIVLALSRTHPLARRKSIPLGLLNGEPFVWIRRSIAPHYYDRVLSACQKGGLTPNVVQEANDHPTMLSLVAGGMGVAFVVGSSEYNKPASVVLRPIPDLRVSFEVQVIWRKDDASPVLRSFLDVVREVRAPRAELVRA